MFDVGSCVFDVGSCAFDVGFCGLSKGHHRSTLINDFIQNNLKMASLSRPNLRIHIILYSIKYDFLRFSVAGFQKHGLIDVIKTELRG